MINKISKYLLIFSIVAFILFLSKCCRAENIDEYISNFTIKKSGKVAVTETIKYNFGTEQRHGIFRSIPYIKTNEKNEQFNIKIDNISITDSTGHSYPYTTSQDKTTGTLTLKIGDPKVYVSGVITYIINYELSGALSYFPNDHDEFYWNVVGTDWGITIDKATSYINLDFEVKTEDVHTKCFTGNLGSSDTNCSMSVYNNKIIISSSSNLISNSGMTVVVGFPNNIVKILEPEQIHKTILEKIMEFILTIFFTIILPVIIIYWYVIFPIILLVKRLGYKKFLVTNQKIVAAWFDPPKDQNSKEFTPAETGALIDKKADHKEVTATIIHLAMRGYLKIRVQDKNKVIFEKLEKSIDDLKVFEKTLYSALFDSGNIVHVDMYERSKSFGRSLQTFFSQIEKSLNEHKLFEKDLTKEKLKYFAIYGIGLFTINFFVVIVNFITRNNYIKFTYVGVEKFSQAKSLYNFLKSQDAQLDFQAENQMFFEKLLPYATAFGVEDIWVKKFDGLKFVQNNWYEGDMSNLYTSSILAHTISSSMIASNSYTSSSHSSSGFSSGFSGGFSGGGGGGGGGGSW